MKILRWLFYLLGATLVYLSFTFILRFFNAAGWIPLVVTALEIGWFFAFLYIITMNEETSYQ